MIIFTIIHLKVWVIVTRIGTKCMYVEQDNLGYYGYFEILENLIIEIIIGFALAISATGKYCPKTYSAHESAVAISNFHQTTLL